MAKSLPYFKFFSSEWNDGDITLLDYKTQGIFINICSYYWSRECIVEYTKLLKRFRDCKEEIEILIEDQIINVKNNKIKISFLDQQWSEREAMITRNKANGNKGGRPKETHSVNSGLAKNNPTLTNIDKIREDKIREDIETRENKFSISAKEKWVELGAEKYLPLDALHNFIGHWTEHGDKDKKMAFEKQKSFGIGRRLGTWKKNHERFNPQQQIVEDCLSDDDLFSR